METVVVMAYTGMLIVNMFLLLAAYNKYTHASRLLEETKKMALRVLLIKKRG